MFNKSYSSENSYNNFYNSFQPNNNLVSMRNFKNKNNLLVNNIENDILNQDIVEITLKIDSSDRDYKVYPSPFSFKVTFNPAPDVIDKKTGKFFKGTPKPTIPFDFSNVKYIRMESIVLPRNCYFIKKYDTKKKDLEINKFSWGYENKTLDQNRFLIIDIKELTHNTLYGTNDNLNKSYGTIYCDKPFSPDFYYGITDSCVKVFNNSQLFDIKTWTINILNDRGLKIGVNIDKTCDTPNTCICKNNNYTDKQKEKCVCKYVRHPLNPKIQVFLTFKIGILTNEINLNPLKN